MVHPVGLLAIVLLGICVLALPRRWSAIPLLVMASFVPAAQRIIIATLDFDFLRIMVIFGFIRLLYRKEYRGFVWNPLDKVLVMWVASAIFFNVVQMGSVSAFVNRLGFGFDSIGMYFLFRCLIKNWSDMDGIVVGIVLISIPEAVCFLIENQTARNPFAFFGGVSEFTNLRQGRLRCGGPFSHPILAGCFWASFLPLMASQWWKSSKGKFVAVTGCSMGLIMVFCSASSTPVMGVIAAFVGGLMFYARHSMKAVRQGVFLSLVGLHFIMEAPVWHLIARVSAVGGSTGYHRFLLIDKAISNFGDWFLYGCSGYTVAGWGIWKGDVTNQYILEGVRGGFVTMVLFFAIIVVAFRKIGKLWRSQTGHPYHLAISWALGVSLFAHCMMYLGVSYFGQTIIAWYLLLAMIGSLSVVSSAKTNTIKASARRTKPVVRRVRGRQLIERE